ncbi:MAG: hypothetical protein R2705_00620 [Ilumatobacteraceae bacterium]
MYVVDAHRIARTPDSPGRSPSCRCFFAVTAILPYDRAAEAITQSIRTAYGKRGAASWSMPTSPLAAAPSGLQQLSVPGSVTSTSHRRPPVPETARLPSSVTARIIAGEGDLLPVSAMPVDGTFPTGTTKFEKRTSAHEIPVWDPAICIDQVCATWSARTPPSARRWPSRPSSPTCPSSSTSPSGRRKPRAWNSRSR